MTQQGNDQGPNAGIRNPFQNYWLMVPWIISLQLPPYEVALYLHYLMVTSYRGAATVYEGETTTAKACHMHRNTMKSARQALIDKKFIRVISYGTPDEAGIKGTPMVLELTDIWERNFRLCATEAQKAQHPPQDEPEQPENPPEVPDEVTGTDLYSSSQNEIPDEVTGTDLSTLTGLGCTDVSTLTGLGCTDVSTIIESVLDSELENPFNADGADAAVEGVGDREKSEKKDKWTPEATGPSQADMQEAKRIHMGGAKTAEIEEDSPSTLLHHPLTAFFMQKMSLTKLNKELRKLLTDDIKIPVEGGGETVFKRGLIAQWNDTAGFDEFCKARIVQSLTLPHKPDPVNILKNLRNFHKTGTNFYGFWEWRKLNPDLCQMVAPERPVHREIDGETPDESDMPVF